MPMIKHIKTQKCPHCGALPCRDSVDVDSGLGKIRLHVSGEQFESRDFACGYSVDYVPNFSREQVTGVCDQDPRVQAIRARRDKMRQAAIAVIDKMTTTDPKYAHVLKSRLTIRSADEYVDVDELSREGRT